MNESVPITPQHLPAQYPLWGSCRMVVTFCAFISLSILTMARSSLSFALVCMVKAQDKQLVNQTDMYDNIIDERLENKYQGEFNWKKELQTRLIAALFYGFILTQGFAGYFCDRFGGKLLFLLGMGLQSVGSMLCPIAARTHPEFLFIVRMFQGCASGLCIPSTFVLFSKWAAPGERTKLIGLAYCGFPLGNMITFSMAGLLCDTDVDGGWPLVFYVVGTFAGIMGILFHFIIFSNPNEHPRITSGEREFLNSVVSNKTNKHLVTPWSAMFRSMPIYAYNVAHFCQSWGFITISSNMPLMLRDILELNIHANGLLSALPYLCAFVTRLGVALFFKPVQNFTKLSLTNMRKVNHILGTYVPAISLISLSFMTSSQKPAALFALTVCTTFTDVGFTSSYLLSYLELATPFAGFLTGISNAIGCTPGCISNTLIGYITSGGTKKEWNVVLYIMATLYFIGGTFYAIFGSSKLQPWAKVQDANDDNHDA